MPPALLVLGKILHGDILSNNKDYSLVKNQEKYISYIFTVAAVEKLYLKCHSYKHFLHGIVTVFLEHV